MSEKPTGAEERPIYLDNNATTPVDPAVLDAMLPYMRECFGNPASRGHAYGWEASQAVDRARRQVADLIGTDARSVIFTSGATEGDNLALLGAARGYRQRGDHVITGATEHKAVLDTCKQLEAEGFRVTVLEPDRTGRISVEQVEEALDERTLMVALMFANNVIGTLHPIAEVGALCRERKVLFFTDAAQAVGKVPIHVERMGIDVLTMSAHKFYGPKGVGALYVRRRNPTVALAPILFGGGHERGMRPGTLNVPGIVGLGEAARLAEDILPDEMVRLAGYRDRFEAKVEDALEDVTVSGHPEHRLPGTSNIAFAGVGGESLMMSLKRLALSSGSACSSSSLEVSHVLTAIGLPRELAQSTLRFAFGRFNTDAEVDEAAKLVIREVRRLRQVSPG